MRRNSLSLLSVASQSLVEDKHLQSLIDDATPEQAESLMRALRSAYQAGQEDSDARTGRLMARIFGGFIGVTPGVDLDMNEQTPRERVRSMVRTLAGVMGRGAR